MHRFKDTKEREWDLSLNCGRICDQIKAATAIDLLEPESGDNCAGIHLLYTQTRLAQSAVWELVKEQAAKLDITTKESFFDDVLDMKAVKEALSKEIDFFIRNQDDLAAVRLEQTRLIDKRNQQTLTETLRSQELHEMVDDEVKAVLKKELGQLREKLSEAVAKAGEPG